MKRLKIFGMWSFLAVLAVTARAAAAGESLTILPAPGGRQSMVALTFDDGSADALSHAAPLLEKRGFRGSFYPIAAQIGKNPGYLNWEQVRELGKRGHEIGNHSMNHHHLTRILDAGERERFGWEVVAAKRMIEEKTGFTPRTFCYPGNGRNPATDVEVLKSHDFVMPWRVGYGEWTTPETHRAEFAKMLEPGKFTVIMLHGIVSGGGGWAPFTNVAIFEKLLDDLKGAGDRVFVGTLYETVSYEARRKASAIKVLARGDGYELCEIATDRSADRYRGTLWLGASPDTVVSVNRVPVPGELRDGRKVFPAEPGDVIRIEFVKKGDGH